MPTPDHRPTAFPFRRQGLDGSAPGALAAVEAAIAVYAVNPSGPLSILARAPGVTAADVFGLEDAGLVVRGRAMRTSAFVVPAASAPMVTAATAQPLERFAWMLRDAGVTPERFEVARAALVGAAGEPRSARDLRAAAGLDGVDVSRFISYLALRGDLAVLGPPSVTSNVSRYLARAPAGSGPAAPAGSSSAGSAPAPAVSRAEAQAWLAGAYLRAFGPARPEDLAWWAALTRAEAGAALAIHETADLGDGLLLHAADVGQYEACPPLPDTPVLIPKWDAWTMGYPLDGRARFVDRDVHDRLFDGDGNGLGAVLVAGRAVGAWSHRGVNGRMEADLDLFERPAPRLREAVEARLASIAVFLGYRGLRVRDVPTVVPDRPRIRGPLA
jgi:hypothetical protein